MATQTYSPEYHKYMEFVDNHFLDFEQLTFRIYDEYKHEKDSIIEYLRNIFNQVGNVVEITAKYGVFKVVVALGNKRYGHFEISASKQKAYVMVKPNAEV